MKSIPKPLLAEWLITQEGMEVVLGIWSRGELFKDVLAAAKDRRAAAEMRRTLDADEAGGVPLQGSRGAMVRDGVAIVSVEGTLIRKADMFSDISGATSYQGVRKDMRAAKAAFAAGAIKGVLLDVNSPGGEANGCCDLADEIRELAALMPVWAHIGGIGASAAYWLASSASRIICSPTALPGSIGARITLVDDSKLDERIGIKTYDIVSGVSPDKRGYPIDEDVLARVQRRVDDLGLLFVDAVALRRNTTRAVVQERFGRGDVLIASRALEAGMVDGIGKFEDALAEMASARPASTSVIGASAGRATRRESTRMNEINGATASMADGKCDGCGNDIGGGKVYCESCRGGEGDEAAAKAAGFTAACSRAELLERIAAQAQLASRVLVITGCSTFEEASAKLVAGSEALRDLEGERTARVGAERDLMRFKLRSTLERGLTSQKGQPPRLSLGTIQTTIPLFVSDEKVRAAMQSAFTAMKETTSEAVLDAACSVDISASDLRAITVYSTNAPPVVAQAHEEPARDTHEEAREISADDKRITTAAAQARQMLDRNSTAAPAAK